jgi:hypothetical protein
MDDLEAIFNRTSERVLQETQDVDYLISQVAMLRAEKVIRAIKELDNFANSLEECTKSSMDAQALRWCASRARIQAEALRQEQHDG